MLIQQKSEQAVLQNQYGKQDALVAQLKANGQALQAHLSKKQAEANVLRNRIAALIAEEQRKAEEERKRKEAEARRAAEEKARREAEARRAEEERRAREEQARIERERIAAAEAARLAEEKAREAELLAKKEAKEKDRKSKAEAERLKKEREKAAQQARKEAELRKKELAKKEAEEREAAKKRERAAADKAREDAKFAEARGRAARSEKKGAATPAKAQNGNFAAMKGSLPKPVAGSFRVTLRFGRQSLPNLPHVEYDNPGIDAEVGRGSAAQAVYGGTVSGVYMVPGFNTVVIVSHGNYYTVYGNLSSAAVKAGENVKAGQRLGVIAPDEDDDKHSVLHFEVWCNREKLNPLEWIR